MSDFEKEVQPPRPWGPAVKIVLLYLLLGPLVGGLVYMTVEALILQIAAILHSGQPQLRGTLYYLSVPYVVFIVSLAYVLGFLPALGCGLLHAAYNRKNGRLPLWCVFALSFFFFLVETWLQFESAAMATAMFLAFMTPMVCCWMISIRFWRTRS